MALEEAMTRWYAVQTRPRKERLAEQHLRNQNFTTFCPQQRRARKVGKRMCWQLEPLFPSYLFVAIDIERQRWRSINGTVGVVHLVSFGKGSGVRPAPLPAGLVERLRELAAKDDVIRFDEQLGQGDRVRVVGGPFDSLCGVLETASAGERVTILLEVLSGATRVSIERSRLILA